MGFFDVPTMALRRVSDIKPHLVLECSFEQKCFGDKREREELELRRNQGFGGRSSPFLVSK